MKKQIKIGFILKLLMFFQLFKLIYNVNGNLNQLKENISKGYVIFV